MNSATIITTTSTILSTILPIFSDAAIQEFQSKFLWVIIAGFVTSFLLGFGMGSNDVANAFGTSVGSKVLSLKQANIMASLMETSGAVLVGYNVVDTVRKSIIEINLYSNEPEILLVGQVAILGGCSCWLVIATLFRLPVSSTHSIVGSTIGFTLIMKGDKGIHWSTVGKIAISWFVSPVLSGIISSSIYMCVDFAVLRRRNPFQAGLRIVPLFYFLCFSFYTFMVLFEGSKVLHLQNIPFWLTLMISSIIGFIASLSYLIIIRPRVIKWSKELDEKEGKEKINNELSMSVIHPINGTNGGISDIINDKVINVKQQPIYNDRAQPFECSPKGIMLWFIPRRDRKEDQRTLRLFSIIQVVTGCFAGFSHGASDVSHTIAPLVAMLSIYNTMSVMQQSDAPLWMMFYGVLGTCFGFWMLGQRVMATIGKKITDINPCNGFAIEFGMAITVLCASKLGIPISTTHCLVGSVMFVGLIKAGEGVDWKVLINVALSWLVTLPASAAFSAGIMWLLYNLFL
ncbi:Phosphate transporter [Meloidogyne graminicola]|uniref:Phosphate transporter n=1 Tax=Meloidogyne graminicola TaxID=189291 RepID=A0A8S9ZGH2_9BILA|nr:Phosphate transporter [Meloidogyne graminicola]